MVSTPLGPSLKGAYTQSTTELSLGGCGPPAKNLPWSQNAKPQGCCRTVNPTHTTSDLPRGVGSCEALKKIAWELLFCMHGVTVLHRQWSPVHRTRDLLILYADVVAKAPKLCKGSAQNLLGAQLPSVMGGWVLALENIQLKWLPKGSNQVTDVGANIQHATPWRSHEVMAFQEQNPMDSRNVRNARGLITDNSPVNFGCAY